jgi:hypothetical protein
VKDGLPEATTVQWAFHFGSDWFLKWGTEKWLLLLRETDAILRKSPLILQGFLDSLDSL